jgi:hypothetical protein
MSQSLHSKSRYRTNNWKQYNAALKRAPDFLVGQGHVMVCRCQRQTGAARSSRMQLSSSPDHQEPVWLGLATELRHHVAGLLDCRGLFQTSVRCVADNAVWMSSGISPSSCGLNLLHDSRGIKFLGEGEWK